MRAALAGRQEGRNPDIPGLVLRLSRAESIDRYPSRQRRRWGRKVQILVDRSQRLIPFGNDQHAVSRHLTSLFDHQAIEFGMTMDDGDQPVLFGADGRLRAYRLPEPGTLVVVLGDLGCLARTPGRLLRTWEQLGDRLRTAGCRPFALTPCPPARWRPDRLPSWTLVAWESVPSGLPPTPGDLAVQALALLRHLSPATRIEPGLLRAMRLLVGGDAGTEADVWQHRAVAGRARSAAVLAPEWARELRQAFNLASKAVKALEILRQWRGDLPPEIWFGEWLNLDPKLKARLPETWRVGDEAAAMAWFTDRAPALIEALDEGPAWFRQLHDWVDETFYLHPDPRLRAAQDALFEQAFRHSPEKPPLPRVFDPRIVEPSNEAREHRVALRQTGSRLQAGPMVDEGAGPGSPFGQLRSANGLISVFEASVPSTPEPAFWESGQPPSWAANWGDDRFGAWVTFVVIGKAGDRVTQKMRWIPPGRFMMGSPENEPGRHNGEGPQHEVTISRGFWLFDTPCTQALWQAVMEQNPSRFPTPERPVETVSWDEVQTFLEKINDRVPGLGLSLPTEAQWEYACRAGTESALNTGPIEILGKNHAPALDPIAWYGGNSGVDFDLFEKRWDSTDWHEQAGTRRVGEKQANGWGLYDMLGNVWEWCADGMRDYSLFPEIDPHGFLQAGGLRVLRGGSWRDPARHVRAASPFRFSPNFRAHNVGFRCARVQE